jgi:peptidoglycan/LPS O-acetylase OafA/YrhL
MIPVSIPNPLVRPYMPELDSLRGIAVLMVLFLHGMAPPLNADLSRLGRVIFSVSHYGGVGVNLFFVLSGFLITGILSDHQNEQSYYRRFYFRRALRILPALYATLLILLLGGWIGWRFLVASLFFLANCAPLLGISLQYPVLWSLAVEEHFYMVWPAMIRRFSGRGRVVLIALIWVLSPLVRAATFYFGRDAQNLDPLFTWCNLDGLVLGAGLALWLRSPVFSRSHLSRVAAPLLAAGLAGFVVLLDHPGLAAAAFGNFSANLGSAGLLSCVLLLGTSQWSFLVDQAFLKFVGFISYGLYLIHVLIFRLTEIAFSRLFHWLILIEMPTAAMLLRFVLGSAFAIGIAYASRQWFEARFLRWGVGLRSTLRETTGSKSLTQPKPSIHQKMVEALNLKPQGWH